MKYNHSKYVKKFPYDYGYTFIRPYYDLMVEAEEKTGINRYLWHRKFDAFIFNSEIPVLSTENEKYYWNKLIKELDDFHYKKGKYSRNWKGGISSENQIIRNSKSYKEWREKVFTRDNYTCQLCYVKGGKLNAHHIKHFSKDKENRLNVDNGITLCINCHKLIHKLEGK